MTEITGQPIERKRGDTAPDKITIMDFDNPGSPLDITGFAYLFTINSVKDPDPSIPYGDEKLQLIGTIPLGTDGIVLFNWNTTNANQEPRQYWYDVQQIDLSGTVKTIVKNTYTFYQDVSK
jgi:hypothetical protein